MSDQTAPSKASERSRRNIRDLVAECLCTCAILIAFSALASYLFTLFPLKFIDPFWQLGLCSATLTTSGSVLIPFLIVFVAYGISPGNDQIKSKTRFISKLSGVLALVLLLIIPLQAFSGFNALKSKTQDILKESKTLKNIAKGVAETRNEQELRAYVASLPNAPNLPDKFDFPFEEVKRRVLANVQSVVIKAENDAETQKTLGTQTFLLEATRNSLQALLLSTAFSVIATIVTRNYNIFQTIVLALLRL